jgi:Sec-independent protein translocase protein TatA
MFSGLNFVHLLVVLVVALLVFGPEEAPRLARRAAHVFRDLQRLRTQLHDEVRGLIDLDGDDDSTGPAYLDPPRTTSLPSQPQAVHPSVTPTGRRTVPRHRPPATNGQSSEPSG